MLGTNTGNLAVCVNNGTGWNTIRLEQGNQGDIWNAANLDLSAFAGQTIQIGMDSETGVGQRGDVAIDAISIQSQPLGISDVLATTIWLYPNPTNGIAQVFSSEVLLTSISIFDITGKLMAQKTVEVSEVQTINLETLRTGIHFVKITTGDGSILKREVKA